MTSTNSVSLWRGHQRGIYFLLPDKVELPNGSYTISRITGLQKHVDLKSLQSYKITPQAAEPYMQEDLSRLYSKFNGLFFEISDLVSETHGKINTQKEVQSKVKSSRQQAISEEQAVSDFFQQMFGVSLTEFVDNPEAAQEHLENLAHQVTVAIEKDNQGEKLDQYDAVKLSVNTILKTLRSPNFDIADKEIEQLIDKIEKTVSNFTEELQHDFSQPIFDLEETTTKIQNTAQQIDTKFPELNQGLMEGLAALNKLQKK